MGSNLIRLYHLKLLLFIYLLSLLLCMNEHFTLNLAFVYASNTHVVTLCLMSPLANEGNLSNMCTHPYHRIVHISRLSKKEEEKWYR